MTTRTVTLTHRRPVQIDTADWPCIAHGRGDSFIDNDYELHLIVRQHADGRVLVYAIYDASRLCGEDHRGGVLLDAPVTSQALVDTMFDIGYDSGISERIIRAAVANLDPRRSMQCLRTAP